MNIHLAFIAVALSSFAAATVSAADIVHDAEYYVLEAQHGEAWAVEDKDLDAKLAELRNKYGKPPNIVYILLDDIGYGEIELPPAGAWRFRIDLPLLVRLGRVAAIVDSQGAPIGLARSDIGDPDDATTAGGPGRVVWSELLAADDAAAASFYSDVVG